MILKSIVKKGLQHADDVEVYYSKSKIRSVAGKRGGLKADFVVDQGVGIRVQVDGKIGFAFTTDSNYTDCIRKAVSIARCKKESVKLEFPCENMPAVDGLYWKETAYLPLEDSIAYLDNLLHVDDQDISQAEGSLEIREMERGVLNSSGLDVFEKCTFADISITVRGSSFVSEDICTHSFQGLNADSLVENLVERAKDVPEKKVREKIDTIILSPGAGSLLLSTLLCPALCADNVSQAQSFLKGYEGKMAASEKLTIRDDATIAGGLVSRSFDAEGSPSRCISVVENGKLIGFLHNLKTAKLKGYESTGSAFRDYRNEPIVFPSNVIIEHENEVSLEGLIEQTDKGVMAKGVIGAYSSDYITGDFSVILDECSLIEHDIARRIRNVSIGGNALNLLKSIECVSKEKIQSGHFVMPYMKISDFNLH